METTEYQFLISFNYIKDKQMIIKMKLQCSQLIYSETTNHLKFSIGVGEGIYEILSV